jgi:uncharacterized membrane protein YsdA (DUF1294 family)
MLPWLYLAVAAINALTFALFWLDKRRARRGRRRLPESTLLWAVFATGLAGGWAAMTLLRHKTRKTSFKLKMLLLSIANPLWGLVYLT